MRNGYTQHLTVNAGPTTELRLNNDIGVTGHGLIMSNGLTPPHPGPPHFGPTRSSRRERLLRDIDSTISTLSLYDDNNSTSSYYPPPLSVGSSSAAGPSSLYEPPLPTIRSSTYLDHHDSRTSAYHVQDTGRSSIRLRDSLVPAAAQWKNGVLDHHHHHHHHPYDLDEDFIPAAATGPSSLKTAAIFHAGSSNTVLDEYVQYKSGSATVPVALPLSEETSRLSGRSYYRRPSAGSGTLTSSLISDYDEADMKSFLAQRNARRLHPLHHRSTAAG